MTEPNQTQLAAFGGQKAQTASTIARAYAAAALDMVQRAPSIATAAAADASVAAVRKHKAAIKAIKASRDESVDPLKDVIAYFKGLWDPSIEVYQEAIRLEKARVVAFEALKVPAAEVMLAGDVAPAEVSKVAAMVAPRAKGSHITTRYSAKIVDASKVRRQHCDPSQTRLNALARALKENFDEPGCELVITKDVTVR